MVIAFLGLEKVRLFQLFVVMPVGIFSKSRATKFDPTLPKFLNLSSYKMAQTIACSSDLRLTPIDPSPCSTPSNQFFQQTLIIYDLRSTAIYRV